MLKFIRKYQRILIGLGAVAYCLSLALSGKMGNHLADGPKDRVIASSISGKKIHSHQIQLLTTLLAAAPADRRESAASYVIGTLNGQVVLKEILESGIGDMIVDRYFEVIAPEFTQILEKIRSHRSYTHSGAPFLQASGVWERFAPGSTTMLAELKTKDASAETLKTLIALYCRQAKVRPQTIGQVLYYQQQQFDWAKEDPSLAGADLSLCGLRTLEEWFGKTFVNIIAQFIVNGAEYARENGLDVTLPMARGDLLANVKESLLEEGEKRELTDTAVELEFKQRLAWLHLPERSVVSAWRDVLLFKQMIHEAGSAALINPMTFQPYMEYVNQAREVESYQLSSILRTSDLSRMLALQTYFDLGCEKEGKDPLAVPERVKLAAEMPAEFLYYPCTLSYTMFKKSDIEDQVSLNETWDWQMQESNWLLLSRFFPELNSGRGKTVDEKAAVLDRISVDDRALIDKKTRELIVKGSDSPFDEKFVPNSSVLKVHQMKNLRLKKGEFPLMGINDRLALFELMKGQKSIQMYSQDGEHFYSIEVTSLSETPQVVALQDLLSDGTLEEMVTKKLEESYLALREKNPEKYKDENGKWRPLHEVEFDVAKVAYAPLLKAIHAESPQTTTPASYAAHRFDKYLKAARLEVMRSGAEALCLVHSKSAPWLTLEKESKVVHRFDVMGSSGESIFKTELGQWSDLVSSHDLPSKFYQVTKDIELTSTRALDFSLAKKALGYEAQRKVALDVLNEIEKKRAIYLGPLTGQEENAF